MKLTDELVAALNERAAMLEVTRSRVLRTAIEEHLKAAHDAEIDATIIEGYARIPPRPDRWAEASARRSIRAEPW